jgi:hypothetical protein
LTFVEVAPFVQRGICAYDRILNNAVITENDAFEKDGVVNLAASTNAHIRAHGAVLQLNLLSKNSTIANERTVTAT